jgi:hypothetical protein
MNIYNVKRIRVKDKLRNRSCCGSCFGGLVGLGGRLVAVTTDSSSTSSPVALGPVGPVGSVGSVGPAFPSDFASAVLDDVLVLSLFVLPEWLDDYFQVRGTTSSVRLRYSERYFLPSVVMK